MKNKKTLYLALGSVFLIMLLLNGVLFYSGNLSGEYIQTTNIWGQQDSINIAEYNRCLRIISALPADAAEASQNITQAIVYIDLQKQLASSTYISAKKKKEFQEMKVPKLLTQNGSGATDTNDFYLVQNLLGKSLAYNNYISSISENALLISKLLDEASDEKGYYLSNIQQCNQDYYGMEYTHIDIVLDNGINMLVQSHTTDILAVITTLIIVALSFNFTKHELTSYTISTSHTMLISVIVATISVVLMYLTNLYLTSRVLSLPSPAVSIQSLNAFYTCPYSISLGTFLVFWVLSKLFTCLILLILVALILTFKHKLIAGIIVLASLIAEYCLHVLPQITTIPNTLQEINIFSGFTFERFFNRYLNLKIGSSAFPRLTVFLILFAICFVLMSIICARRLHARIAITQAELQQTYYTEVDKRYQDTRRLWHDFNNHLITIKALYNSGHADEANEYIDAISAQGKDYLLPTRTGRDAVDLLLFQKNRFALESGIRIEFVTGCNLSKFHFADYDLCSLLGNLLDNALEACKALTSEKLKIDLKLEEHGNMLFISCSNPYCGELKQENGSFETTKSDTENHGIGLSSVRQVCKKYDGSTDINTEDGIFTVSCLLNSPM